MTLLKQTFERLVASGYTEHPAKEKIVAVLSYEVYDVLRDKRKFDREKFVSYLPKIEGASKNRFEQRK